MAQIELRFRRGCPWRRRRQSFFHELHKRTYLAWQIGARGIEEPGSGLEPLRSYLVLREELHQVASLKLLVGGPAREHGHAHSGNAALNKRKHVIGAEAARYRDLCTFPTVAPEQPGTATAASREPKAVMSKQIRRHERPS